MSIKILQLHKRESRLYKNIQDKYSYSLSNNIFAIADGTTKSYNSEKWASLITDSFVRSPKFNSKQLIEDFKNCANRFKELKFELSSNFAIVSLEKEKIKKGATATFIGVEITKKNELKLICSGDSCLFIISKNKVSPIPFDNIESLDSNKHFLNTEKILKGEVDESYFIERTFEINDGDTLLIASDAISRLILKNHEAITDILEINSFDNLLSFCLKNWESNRLEEDDITALIITDFNQKKTSLIVPPENFIFPKTEEPIFVPVSNGIGLLNSSITQNDMQNLLNSIKTLQLGIFQIKKKLKFTEFLLVAFMVISIAMTLQVYILVNKISENRNIEIKSLKEKLDQNEIEINSKEREINKLQKKSTAKNDTVIAIKKSPSIVPISKKLIKDETKKATKDSAVNKVTKSEKSKDSITSQK